MNVNFEKGYLVAYIYVLVAIVFGHYLCKYHLYCILTENNYE